jgi:hypothetical protein
MVKNNRYWLVVQANHLEKWWTSSMGRMTSHMKWKIQKGSKPPTSYCDYRLRSEHWSFSSSSLLHWGIDILPFRSSRFMNSIKRNRRPNIPAENGLIQRNPFEFGDVFWHICKSLFQQHLEDMVVSEDRRQQTSCQSSSMSDICAPETMGKSFHPVLWINSESCS